MSNNKSYVQVDTKDKFKEMASHIENGGDILAYDIETNSLNPRKGKIIGISLTCEEGLGYYLPTMIFKNGELQDNYIENVNCHDLAKLAINLMKSKKIIGHNLSFDCRFTKEFYGIDLVPFVHADTMLLVHTVQEEGSSIGRSFGLKNIAKSIQNEIGFDAETEANNEQIELKASIKANGGAITQENYEIWKADIEILSKYAAADVDLTFRLYNYYIKVLEKEKLVKFFFEDEVMPLYKEVTIPMESRGVRLNLELMNDAYSRITADLEKHKDLVTKELLKKDAVREWIILKALDAHPPTNRGRYAQEVLDVYNIEMPKSEKNGKYIVNQKTRHLLPDGPAKDFLNSNDPKYLGDDMMIKIAVNLWKKENDGVLFNIQSKDHMGGITFEALKIRPNSQTATGKPQFDDDFIQTIFEKHEWAKNLRIYNKLLKIKSTYMDRFLDKVEDGKYFFSYKQHGTVSGRYGSDAQQLPRPIEEGDEDEIIVQYNNLIRAFFIPYEGNIFIDDDYASLEPSVFAHVSGDEGLMDIFKNGWDFYSTIAIKTEGYNEYSPDKKADNFLRKHLPKVRNKAKAYALGIPYGMGDYALGKNLGISTKEAGKLVEGYLDGFPKLKQWMERSRQFVKENGYVRTQTGRIRHLNKVKTLHEAIGDGIMEYKFRKQLEYQYGAEEVEKLYKDYKNGINNSMNVQIQGLAASIVNRAAIAINRELIAKGIKGQVVAQIHDQLIIEVEKESGEEAAKIVQDKMENTTKLDVPLYATPCLTMNWKDGH